MTYKLRFLYAAKAAHPAGAVFATLRLADFCLALTASQTLIRGSLGIKERTLKLNVYGFIALAALKLNIKRGVVSMLIRSFIVLLCCLSSFFAVAVKADADVVSWRFSHFLPATHALSRDMLAWSEALSEATDQRIQITTFPASQLGSGLDHYDMVRTQVAHLAWIVPGYEQGRFPIFSVLETPFLISNAAKGARSFHEWYPEYADLEMPEVVPCLFTTSPPGKLNFKTKKIVSPDDMKGARIRVANATVGRYVRSLGGVTINIPLSEARHALERGMMDGTAFGPYTITALSLDKSLKKHLDMPFSSSPAIVGLNKKAYQSLAPDLQDIVDQFCTPEHSAKVMTSWQRLAANADAEFRETGLYDIYKIPPETSQAWIDKAVPLIDEWQGLAADKGVKDPEAALEDLRQVIRVNNADVRVAATDAPAIKTDVEGASE